MELFIGLSIGIFFFAVSYLGFRTGLRLGMDAANGIKPPPVRNPVQVVSDIKHNIEVSKEAKEELKEVRKMFEYTGDILEEGE